MTEITIRIPSQLEFSEDQTIERNRIPLIPATQITGQLLPEQIPLGVIPELENFEQINELLEALQAQVDTITQGNYLTGPELDEQLEPIEAQITTLETGLGGKAAQSQVTAIDQALGSLTAAVAQFQTALEGKAAASHPHTIAAITGLTTALNDLQDQINGLQQQDSDLAAIAALNTQPFGRSLLTLSTLAAAKALLEIPAASTGSPSASELTYTVSQSSIWPGSSTLTTAVLTDGNINTGGGTNTSGANWIKADLGSAKTIERLTVAGGNPPTYSGAASALNNRLVQVSLDDVTWTTLLTVTGATDTAVSVVVLPTVKARYLRLFISTGGVGTTELRIFGY